MQTNDCIVRANERLYRLLKRIDLCVRVNERSCELSNQIRGRYNRSFARTNERTDDFIVQTNGKRKTNGRKTKNERKNGKLKRVRGCIYFDIIPVCPYMASQMFIFHQNKM